eukprot:COSAG01_NODE_15951_length_1283_cov_2.086149_1_plen_37_part_10
MTTTSNTQRATDSVQSIQSCDQDNYVTDVVRISDIRS